MQTNSPGTSQPLQDGVVTVIRQQVLADMQATAGQEQPNDAAVPVADRGPVRRGAKLTQNSLLTPTQVADRLQVSVAWVRDHSTRKHPRIPVVRVGGLLRYHPEDIDRWLQDLRGAGLRKAS
jgi:hypothetical protein